MKKYFDVLRKCPLFEGIADRDIFAMLGCLDAKITSYHKNETIFSEGEPAKYIGILLAGKAQIVRVDYYGNRSIVTSLSPCELFGEAFACAQVKALPISVVASQDAQVMLIDCRRMLHFCSNSCEFHSRMIFNLLKVVAQKNLLSHQRSEIISQRTTRGKLMAYLMLQAKQKGSDRFTVPFNRQELADYLEVDRSGLSAQISKLRKEGVLKCHRSEFKLL